MAVPKKKTTHGRKGRRRSHHALKPSNYSFCEKCKSPVLPHTACRACGTYNGETAIKPKVKKEGRRKRKEREAKEQAATEKAKEAKAEKKTAK